jgi:hypothetical protein
MMWKEAIVAELRNICLARLRKITKISVKMSCL